MFIVQGTIRYRKDSDILHCHSAMSRHTVPRDPGTGALTYQGVGWSDTEGVSVFTVTVVRI